MIPTMSRAASRVLVPACVGGTAVAAVLTGCGNSAPGPKATTSASPRIENGVQVFDVSGLTTLAFSPNELDAKPGEIRIDFSVPAQSPPHDFVIASLPGA